MRTVLRAAKIAIAPGLGIGGTMVAWLALGGWHAMAATGDAWNYLAAGERLNAGHLLYALGPNDRYVELKPPYWSVPLLAPPPIAVLWRPLALIGDSSMVIWGVAALVAVAAGVFALRRFGLALALLSAPLALTALSGNASAFALAGLVAAWAFRDRPWVVGGLVAAMAMVKLTPVVLVVWLVVTRRYRAMGAVLAMALAIGAVSIAGAGTDAWRAWLESVPRSAPSPLALASVLGVSTWAVAAAFGVTVVAAWLVTRNDRLVFAAAVVAAACATPALYFQAIALLPAAVAPWALAGSTSERAGRTTPQADRTGPDDRSRERLLGDRVSKAAARRLGGTRRSPRTASSDAGPQRS